MSHLARSLRDGIPALMNIAIRTATAADIAILHEIRSAVRENRLSDPGSITTADYLPFIEAGGAWVAEMEGGVAGFAALDCKTGTVWALFVHPAAEGAGIGRALHRHLVGWARDQGLRSLSLKMKVAPGGATRVGRSRCQS
jgi:GNAT superfamily N-acetyltransferase